MELQYQEHFTAFIDFLGFSEASIKTDDASRLKVLDLLLSLSELRGDFDLQSIPHGSGKRSTIKPAISTFSDHIVVSFPLDPIDSELGPSEDITSHIITSQFTALLTSIAARALRMGFLVRGGATIGKLYHARGVVFGEALLDAFQIESRTSIYPRVVLSSQITGRPSWVRNHSDIVKGSDGLYHLDYFRPLLLQAAPPGEGWAAAVKDWFIDISGVIAKNLTELENGGKLNELAKWVWFAHEFQSGLKRLPPQILESLGVSTDEIEWPK